MKKQIILVLLVINNAYLFSQQVTILDFETLQNVVKKPNDTTYIVNFFASWCAPCVKELPEFIDFAAAHKDEKVQVIFVSLDFKKNYKKVLPPLSIKLKIKDPIFLLDEPNANNWINAIDTHWSGDIPATWFINSKQQISKLFAQCFTNETLFQTFKSLSK